MIAIRAAVLLALLGCAFPQNRSKSVIGNGIALSEAREALRAAGAVDMSDSVGIHYWPGASDGWYLLADGTCIQIQIESETRDIITWIQVGPRGSGYRGKHRWSETAADRVDQIRLDEFLPPLTRLAIGMTVDRARACAARFRVVYAHHREPENRIAVDIGTARGSWICAIADRPCEDREARIVEIYYTAPGSQRPERATESDLMGESDLKRW